MKLAHSVSAFATMSDLIMALSQLEQQPEPLLDETFHQRLSQAEAALRAAVTNLDQAKTAKRRAAAERRDQGGTMIRSVRDFHQNLRRTAKRDPAAQTWLEAFNLKQALPEDSTLSTRWYEQARQIAEAGAATAARLAASSAAFTTPPPSSPSAEQVAASLASALTTHQTYLDACVAQKQAESAARAASAQGQRLLTVLRKRLAGLFHELPPELRRAEMVKYGVRYARATPTTETAGQPSQPRDRDQVPA